MKNLQLILYVFTTIIVLNLIGILGLHLHAAQSVAKGAPVVDVKLILPNACDVCFNASQNIGEMRKLGVTIGKTKTYVQGTSAAKRLIKKYGLTKLPALLFSKELGGYDTIAQAWTRIGAIAKDGTYILAGTPPPFYDLEEQRVRGVIEPIYLTDESCTECYNVSVHTLILKRLGLSLTEGKTVDISSTEGQQLLEQYDITAVPTILLRGDAELYPNFEKIWAGVGRQADDGTYIFTKMSALGLPYKDLTNDTVVQPKGQ